MQWIQDKHGILTLNRKPNNSHIPIQNSITHNSEHITSIPPHKAYKLLGVHIALDGNMIVQYKATQDKCTKHANIFAQCQFCPTDMQLMYNQVFMPTVKYSLAATVFTDQQCNTLQQHVKNILITKLGYNRHMPLALSTYNRHTEDLQSKTYIPNKALHTFYLYYKTFVQRTKTPNSSTK